ncbi:MAG: GH92 family glycosyl hydrolase [Pseudomonadota bacterium]
MPPTRAPFLLLALAACAPEEHTWPEADPLPWVDPFIGTGGKGFGEGSSYPGARAPWGMVAISPDSRTEGTHIPGFHNGGYWYEDHLITGFSHLHLQGTGAPDYGNLLFMPWDGFCEALTHDESREAPFDHANEEASPGYYSVTFDDGVQAELTAGLRTGVHRYTFPAGSEPTVVIDLEHQIEERAPEEEDPARLPAAFHLDPATGVVTGTTHAAGALSGRTGGFLVHFWAQVDPAPTTWGTWADADPVVESTDAEGYHLGGWLGWPTTGEPTIVTVKVGLSFVSPEAAAANWQAEAQGLEFDGLRAQTEELWRSEFDHLRVHGGTDRERTLFYSSLYRAMLMPNLRSDADGRYVGFDGEIHEEPDDPFYSDMSLWDTYRTLHPLVDLAYPEHAGAFASSLVRQAQQSGGCLPRWPCGQGDSGSMVGDPADIVLADAALKGIGGWDEQAGWEAATLCADGEKPSTALSGGRSHIESYLTRGWIGSDEESGSVSKTMEYAVADGAMAAWARARGSEDAAVRYGDRSRYYLNLWDAAEGFFRGRDSDGVFEDTTGWSGTSWEEAYTEGNAWQYLWLAPHDPDRLADVFGGQEAALDLLDAFFADSAEEEDSLWPELYYWHGNEPDLHVPFLYALLGAPERGAPWVRWVRETRYGTGADGIDGNDDGGTLAAWYVLAALGLYPVTGTPVYALGPPVFPRVEVWTPGGTLTIVAEGNPLPSAARWLGAALDGEVIEGGTLTHAQIARDGILRFEVGPPEPMVESERAPLP